MELHPWNAYTGEIGMVALIASAGGLGAFHAVLSRLHSDFTAPILICQHRCSRKPGTDALVEILSRSCKLRVMQAQTGMSVQAGMVYVAPPDRHLLVVEGKVKLCESPPVNRNRPSMDLLLGSLASQFGSRLIAVVLSGSLSDGAVGVVKVKAAGGRVIVQEPLTASAPGMPRAAISSGCADFVLPLTGIADALTTLAMVPGALKLFPASRPLWVVSKN